MEDKKKTQYQYTIKTLSPLILSPRVQNAFYQKIDFDEGLKADGKEVNIIYPFYQYGMYEKYDPDHGQYYIPGSSVKGAVGAENFTVDDIRVNGGDLHLGVLWKVQYADPADGNGTGVQFQPFFPNVAVEMLNIGAECPGCFFAGEAPQIRLQRCHGYSLKKLEQYIKRLRDIVDMASTMQKEMPEVLGRAISEGEDLLRKDYGEDTYLVILGGYKGLVLSKILDTEDAKSGIFIDKASGLPHGLVELKLLKG